MVEWLVLVSCSMTCTQTQPADCHTSILDWCAVKLHHSGFCRLLHEDTCPFLFPCSLTLLGHECGTESLLVSFVRPYYAEFLTLDTQQEAFALWQFPHPQVFRDCDDDDDVDDDGDHSDNCHASVHGPHSLSGLHCSTTLINSRWVRSIYDCE